MNPSHKALRDATAEAHERVDSAFGGFDLTDRAHYARFLLAHADAVWPIEAALDAAGAERIAPDWPERKRGALLREDLALLRPLPDRPVGDTPEIAPPADDAELAGLLYVIEGSRLGGRFLARQLGPGLPHAYLDPDQDTGKWRNLLDRLDSILYDAPRLQSAIASARRAFAAFEHAARVWCKE